MPQLNPFTAIKKLLSPRKKKDAGRETDLSGSIGLYGLSRAGKTVYLTVAFRESTLDVFKAGRFKLTTRHHDTLREMLHNRDLLEGRSEYGRPVFPPPTQAGRLYHFDAHVSRKYIYPFRTMDYKGEGLDLTRSSGGKETIEFLSSCHCLLFLYEPDEQMLDRRREDIEFDEPSRMRRIELFTTMIENLRKAGDRPRLDMPIGLIMTKADQLEGYQSLSEEETVLLNRKLSNAKFADAADFTRKVLDQPHIRDNPAWSRQVSRILTGLTLFWDHIVAYAPSFQVFFVSATGGVDTFTGQDGEPEVVPPSSFRSKGVLNPLHWVVSMLEIRRRIRVWRGWLVRLAVISLILHGVVFLLDFTVIRRQLGYDLDMVSSPSRIGQQDRSLDKRWQYYFYPVLRSELATVSAANRIKRDLEALIKRSEASNLPSNLSGDERTSRQLVDAIRGEYPRIRTAQGLREEIEEKIAILGQRLDDNIRSQITAGAYSEEDEARTVGRLHALDDPDGAAAARLYTRFRTGDEQQYAMDLYSSIQRLGSGDDVTSVPRLRRDLEELQDLLSSGRRYEGIDGDLVGNWLDALTAVQDDRHLAGVYADTFRFPLLRKLAELDPAASQGVDTDPEYVKLVNSLNDRRDDPLMYYTSGERDARSYLSRTQGRKEPAVADNRRKVQDFLSSIERWRQSGLPAEILVTQEGTYPAFFEVVGDGAQAEFRGPHKFGSPATVTWRLESGTGGGGIRLYFSPSENRPRPGQVLDVLNTPMCVTVGMPELLSGRDIRVGLHGVKASILLGNPEILPVLKGAEPPRFTGDR